jgi:hypothetical protein
MESTGSSSIQSTRGRWGEFRQVVIQVSDVRAAVEEIRGRVEHPGNANRERHCSNAERRRGATPHRGSPANGLVRIGEEAVAKRNDALLDEYFTDDYRPDSPVGTFNRDEIKAYFAALREASAIS